MDDIHSCLACQKTFGTQRQLRGHEAKCQVYQQLQSSLVHPRKRPRRTLADAEDLYPPDHQESTVDVANVNTSTNPQDLPAGSSSGSRDMAATLGGGPMDFEDNLVRSNQIVFSLPL